MTIPNRPFYSGHAIPCAILLALVAVFFPFELTAQPAADRNTAPSADRDSPPSDHGPNRYQWPFLKKELLKSYYLDRPRAPEIHTAFYPPTPPPLESELPLLKPAAGETSPPPELAAFVTDWFYSLLAQRLSRNELTDNIRHELQSYLTTRTRLQNELRAKLAELTGAPAGKSNQDWSQFCERQAASINDLEEQAEKIASLLRRTDVLGNPADYPGDPGKNLKLAKESGDAHLEAATLRAAAFFEEGFSTAQRRLLIAAAIDLDHDANPGSSTPSDQREWLFSLAPEPARIRLASALPATLAEKISDYVAERRSLKAEICDALIGHAADDHQARKAALAALAVAQKNRYSTLDAAADEIRRDLNAQIHAAGPQPAPTLPPDLANRIALYRQRKLEVLEVLYALLTHPEASPARTATTANENDSASPTTWTHEGATRTVARPANLRASTAEFEATQKKLLDELNREQSEIREALAAHFRSVNKPAGKKSLDDLLKDFETARRSQEIGDKYRDYQTALLRPGLTPGQRRLLFAAAVEQLALPLPNAENMP